MAQMTPQEEQMLLAQILKQQGGGLQAPPVSLMGPSANTNPYGGGAMGNPYNPPAPAAGPAPDARYAAANMDTSAQEADIAQQQRMAEALMEQQKTPGLITAGRVSHAGASPFSALASGIRGYGAGKQSKEAREKTKALEKTLARKAEAKGGLALEKTEREVAEEARKAQLEADRYTMDKENITADNKRADSALQQTITAAADARGKREVAVFHNPNYNADDPESSPTVSYRVSPEGFAEDINGVRIDATTLTPWKAPTTKAGAAGAGAGADEGAPADLTGPSRQISILRNKYFPTASGQTVDRLKGQFFPSWTEEGGAIESYQRELQTQQVDNLVDDLKKAKLTPVSDKDLETLKSKLAGIENTPHAILGYMTQELRPRVSQSWDASIKKGTHTLEQKQQYMDQLDAAYIHAAMQEGVNYPLEKLVTQGVNPELIELEQLRRASR